MNRLSDRELSSFAPRDEVLHASMGGDPDAPFHPLLLAIVIISPLLIVGIIVGVALTSYL